MAIPNLTLEQRTAFAEVLASKDQDVLKEVLSLVYDAAIKAIRRPHNLVQFEASPLNV